MIFAVEGHIEMIWNGLFFKTQKMEGINLPIVKTQTRRLNRGIYRVGKDYAVQKRRGVKAEPGIRIVMDRIWKEEAEEFIDEYEVVISQESAWAEGGYTPTQFEELFANLNPEWLGWSRWAFKFHVVAIRKEVSGITSHAREERVKKTFYPLLRGMC